MNCAPTVGFLVAAIPWRPLLSFLKTTRDLNMNMSNRVLTLLILLSFWCSTKHAPLASPPTVVYKWSLIQHPKGHKGGEKSSVHFQRRLLSRAKLNLIGSLMKSSSSKKGLSLLLTSPVVYAYSCHPTPDVSRSKKKLWHVLRVSAVLFLAFRCFLEDVMR